MMIKLYPSIKPYATHMLKVSAIHHLYIEEAGNPRGLPVLSVHGGPGAGSDPNKRRFFDPNIFRIIQFDQRGCGLSKPHASLTDNTTEHLINDIEAIRKKLNISQWLLFAGGWGATLSLLYAQSFPEHVLYMLLWGLGLGRVKDVDWMYGKGAGASQIFPEAYQQFVNFLPKIEQKKILLAYQEKLNGLDELSQMAAAKAWLAWEHACISLEPLASTTKPQFHFCLTKAKIENHFLINNLFIAPNVILKRAKALKDIPGILVHGRYDIISPVANAVALHALWPRSELQILREAGHLFNEAFMLEALINNCNKISLEFNS